MKEREGKVERGKGGGGTRRRRGGRIRRVRRLRKEGNWPNHGTRTQALNHPSTKENIITTENLYNMPKRLPH